MTVRIGYRHCDPRYPFLWQSAAQPAARWHGADEGPANYFSDTPTGAWAEFLRHEGITEEADLVGVQRSLWAVEVPQVDAAATPQLPEAVLFGAEHSYPACQQEARRLRKLGHTGFDVPGAALLPGEARGWTADAAIARETTLRQGRVWVHFGTCAFVGWVVVKAGSPPADVLPLVRHL